MISLKHVAVAVSALLTSTSAYAAPVVVTVTKTTNAGLNTYDFSVTNNIGGTGVIYFFGVDLDGTISGTPSSWPSNASNVWPTWNNENYGGSSTVYQSNWIGGQSGIVNGQTTSGFQVTTAADPVAIKFFAYANNAAAPANDGHFNNSSNPGYEGFVSGVTAAVPEPMTWAMMVVGFGLVGGAMRRRRVNTTVSFA